MWSEHRERSLFDTAFRQHVNEEGCQRCHTLLDLRGSLTPETSPLTATVALDEILDGAAAVRPAVPDRASAWNGLGFRVENGLLYVDVDRRLFHDRPVREVHIAGAKAARALNLMRPGDTVRPASAFVGEVRSLAADLGPVVVAVLPVGAQHAAVLAVPAGQRRLVLPWLIPAGLALAVLVVAVLTWFRPAAQPPITAKDPQPPPSIPAPSKPPPVVIATYRLKDTGSTFLGSNPGTTSPAAIVVPPGARLELELPEGIDAGQRFDATLMRGGTRIQVYPRIQARNRAVAVALPASIADGGYFVRLKAGLSSFSYRFQVKGGR
jgi:hypothetical protein